MSGKYKNNRKKDSHLQKIYGSQNFLTSRRLLERIVRKSTITKNDLVIEIGTGKGHLTEVLCRKAEYVYSVEIDRKLYERAKEHRDSHITDAATYEEFQKALDQKPGFIRAMWCGDQACEDKIKEDTTATSRCMPFEQEQISDVCVCCGKPAKKLVFWGKAY